jgi:predicted ATPase
VTAPSDADESALVRLRDQAPEIPRGHLFYQASPDGVVGPTALTLAKEIGSRYCETFALDFITWIHVLRREAPAAQASVDALMAIAPEQGFQFLLADSRVLHGWILAAQGTGSDGVGAVVSAEAAYEATGARVSRPAHLILVTQIYGKSGQIAEAIATLADARATMEQTGEKTYDAEQHRLQGELMLTRAQLTGGKRAGATSAAAEAAACFQKAIAVARRQRAKSLELRAVMSLCRLSTRSDQRKRSRRMLGEIYDSFSEGFDTPDLRDAQILLAQLA